MQYKRRWLLISSFCVAHVCATVNADAQQEQVVDEERVIESYPEHNEQQVRAQVDPTVLSCIAEAIIEKYCPDA